MPFLVNNENVTVGRGQYLVGKRKDRALQRHELVYCRWCGRLVGTGHVFMFVQQLVVCVVNNVDFECCIVRCK